MKLISEIITDHARSLIISSNNFSLIELLKTYLKEHQVEIFFSPKTPPNIQNFNYLFFFNPQSKDIKKILSRENNFKRIVLLFIKQSKNAKMTADNLKGNKKIKVIDIKDENINKKDLENILWFSFSESNQNYLRMEIINPPLKTKKIENKKPLFFFYKKLTFKKIFFFFLIILFFVHLLFIPFVLMNLLINYRIYKEIKKENFVKINHLNSINKKILNNGYYFYQIVRPTYLFFSLAIIPDNLFDILNALHQIYDKGYLNYLNSKLILISFLKPIKNEREKQEIITRINYLKSDVEEIENNLKVIFYKTPGFFLEKHKKEVTQIKELINIFKLLIKHEKDLFGASEEKKYLLLFANNRELRPGGGFIGSFGLIRVADYSLKEIKIYDVYDADGQLKIHIEPPEPIKKYLHQPHWYLRDSNFSPDFYENYQKAKFFLSEEFKWLNYDGAVLLTTSAIEEILKSFGDLYLPDFKENINSNNFFIKAQMYAEKNFFPGSIQKKSFLSSLMRQIIINTENASLPKLLFSLKTLLDEKQIVIYLENQNLQKIIDNLSYSGRIIKPRCTISHEDCINDYLFFYDANLGVNKADYFISKQIVYYIKINPDGKISQNLTLEYLNNSPSMVFPGGIYRNYFQLIFPKTQSIDQITKDGILIENYDVYPSMDDFFQRIGFYFEVQPKRKATIKIIFRPNINLKKGKQIYQLIIQKQIGAKNHDLILNITLPKNVSLINQNFIPLVKNNDFVYNSILNADKIFFMEFNYN